MDEERIIAYKGFNFDLTCGERSYIMHYKEDESYFDPEYVSVCEKGYHACLNPEHVFRYYNDFDSVYYKVELSGVIDRSRVIKDDSKVCANNIRLLEKIGGPLDMLKFSIKENKREDLYSILDIEDKFIGVIRNKKDFEKYKEKGIKVGHRFLFIDGEIDAIWRCIEKREENEQIRYYFQTENIIDINYIDNELDIFENFSETKLYKRLNEGLGKRLKKKLGDHIGTILYDKTELLVNLPSDREVCRDYIEENFVWYKYLNLTNQLRTHFWLRSVVSSSDFAYAGGDGYADYDDASGRAYVRPLINIG